MKVIVVLESFSCDVIATVVVNDDVADATAERLRQSDAGGPTTVSVHNADLPDDVAEMLATEEEI